MFDFLRQFRKSEEERRQEQVNAYLDGELSATEQRRFEAKLEGDETLRREVEALQMVQRSLRQVPRLRAPRSFTLDPAVYGKSQPAPVTRLYPVLRTATALTALFVVILLGAGLAGGDLGLTPLAGEAEMAMDAEATQAVAAESAPEEEAAPAAALAVEEETADAAAEEPAMEMEAADEAMEEEAGVAEMSPPPTPPPGEQTTLEAVSPVTTTLATPTPAGTSVAAGEEAADDGEFAAEEAPEPVVPRPSPEPGERVAAPEEIPTAPATPAEDQALAAEAASQVNLIQVLIIIAGLLFLGLLAATFYARRYVP